MAWRASAHNGQEEGLRDWKWDHEEELQNELRCERDFTSRFSEWGTCVPVDSPGVPFLGPGGPKLFPVRVLAKS